MKDIFKIKLFIINFNDSKKRVKLKHKNINYIILYKLMTKTIKNTY